MSSCGKGWLPFHDISPKFTLRIEDAFQSAGKGKVVSNRPGWGGCAAFHSKLFAKPKVEIQKYEEKKPIKMT